MDRLQPWLALPLRLAVVRGHEMIGQQTSLNGDTLPDLRELRTWVSQTSQFHPFLLCQNSLLYLRLLETVPLPSEVFGIWE
jgi:hypothetical protein